VFRLTWWPSGRGYCAVSGKIKSALPTASGGEVDVRSPQSWNRYAYVMNNPLGMVDPLGLCGEDGGLDDCPPDTDDGGLAQLVLYGSPPSYAGCPTFGGVCQRWTPPTSPQIHSPTTAPGAHGNEALAAEPLIPSSVVPTCRKARQVGQPQRGGAKVSALPHEEPEIPLDTDFIP
jgi:hypothetical protein